MSDVPETPSNEIPPPPQSSTRFLWGNEPPLSPTPAVMMPPVIFSPTASTSMYNQQPPMLFTPVILQSPQQPAARSLVPQMYSPPNSPTNNHGISTFTIQPLPGICISSPVANEAPPALTINTSDQTNTLPPQLCSPQASNKSNPGISGLFSPTPTGAQSQYYIQQRFENLFLSPQTMRMQYAPLSAPSPHPRQAYYDYASNNAYTYNDSYCNQQGVYRNNHYPDAANYRTDNQQQQYYRNNINNYYNAKKTYNVLPKRRLEYHDRPSNSSKREAVLACLVQLKDIFQEKIDEAGFRGPTALRIRVKTWNAIKHIVPFLLKASAEVKINKVSFPKSTKGLGKVIRGFLAYVLVDDLQQRKKMHDLFDEYQKNHNYPFKKLEITDK